MLLEIKSSVKTVDLRDGRPYARVTSIHGHREVRVAVPRCQDPEDELIVGHLRAAEILEAGLDFEEEEAPPHILDEILDFEDCRVAASDLQFA